MKWTYDKLKEEALKYNNRRDLRLESSKAYNTISKRGLLNELCSHMVNILPSKEKVLSEALKYTYHKEFKETKYYNVAKRLGIYKEVTAHLIAHSKWKKADIHKEALKYNTRTKFHDGSRLAYRAAKRKGILDLMCSHMESPYRLNKTWTVTYIEEIGSKYTSRSEFYKMDQVAYTKARKLGILDKISKDNNYRSLKVWTYDKLKLEALKYKTKSDFKANNRLAYVAMQKRGIVEKLCSHMNNTSSKSPISLKTPIKSK